MDFGFSEEQEMLRDAAKRFLADNCSTKFVRQMMADATAHDPGFWQKLVLQGWPGLLIPEQYGGANGTFLDLTVVVEEMGKALVPGPFLAAALLGAPTFIEGASDALKNEFLPKMAEGKFIATVAIAEAAGRFDAGGIELKATQKGLGYTLSGEKFFVPDAHVADAIVVAARTGPGSGEDGITLLCVPAKEKGVTVTQLKTVDMTRRACHVKFDDVQADTVIGKENAGWPVLRAGPRDRDRRPLDRDGRDRAKGARHRGRVRQDPRAVRQADRLLSGGQAQMCRHDGGGRERPLARPTMPRGPSTSGSRRRRAPCRWRRRTPRTWRKT